MTAINDFVNSIQYQGDVKDWKKISETGDDPEDDSEADVLTFVSVSI